MCLTCGCGEEDARVVLPHRHEHVPPVGGTETLELRERLLAGNDHRADHVRDHLAARRVTAVNLMSSPGAGKTSLLEQTIRDRADRSPIVVVEGDQETSVDADRIVRAGARAVQVNTGSGCHLDAGMVDRALHALDPPEGSLLFVENVGNLVCPALFDVGEHARVVVVSVTEGDDKPLKYPAMFAAADVVVVNKVDLLPHLALDLGRLAGQARSLRPDVVVLPLSVWTGQGLADWYAWLDDLVTRPPAERRRGAGHGAAVST